MRTVTLVYDKHSFSITDCDGQTVQVNYDPNGGPAKITSFLHGDEIPVESEIHPHDAEINALYLVGIPYEYSED